MPLDLIVVHNRTESAATEEFSKNYSRLKLTLKAATGIW